MAECVCWRDRRSTCVYLHKRASVLAALPLILDIGFDIFAVFGHNTKKVLLIIDYYKKGCCFLVHLIIVQQKLGLLQLSFGTKSIFLFGGLSM